MADPRDTKQDSEGVECIRYPRTDFPQQGWIRKPTVEGTTGDFYEAITDFGWFRPTQSENEEPTARRVSYGLRQTTYDFYQTQPFPVWPGEVFPDAWGIPAERMARGRRYWTAQWHETSWIPTAARRQSWEIDAQRMGERIYRTNDWIDTSWIFTNLTAAFDPAIQSWTIHNVRTAERLARIQDDTQVAWIFPNLPTFDAAIQSWAIPTALTDKRHTSYLHWRTAPLGFATPIAAFDPAIQSWTIHNVRTAERTYRIQDDAQVAWIYPNLPAGFDPAIQSWQIPTDLFSSVRRYLYDMPPSSQGGPLPASWSIISDRPAKPRRDPRLETPIPGPARIPTSWLLDSQRIANGRPQPFVVDQPVVSWLVPSVLFDPSLWPGTTQQGDRLWHRPHRLAQQDRDVAWIFQNLPAGFNPAIQSWTIPTARFWQRGSNYLQWRTAPLGFATPIAAFDPAIQSWTIHNVRTAERLARIQDDIQVAWIYPTLPTFDPAVQNWTIESRRTTKPRTRSYDEYGTAWLYQNLQAFDPAIQSWTIQSESTQKRRQRLHDDYGTAWIYPNLPAFNPAVQSWAGLSERVVQKRQRHPDLGQQERGIFNAFHWPIQADRPATSRRGTPRPADIQDVAWIYPNLPTFNPATVDWGIHSLRPWSRRWRTADPIPQSWIVPAEVYDPKLWPANTLSSERLWKKARGLWQPSTEQAWIFQNIPAPFDPTQMAWNVPDLRMAKPTSRLMWWASAIEVGRISIDLPPVIPTIVPPGGSLEGCHILSGVAAEGCGIQTAGSTECDDMQSGPAREV